MTKLRLRGKYAINYMILFYLCVVLYYTVFIVRVVIPEGTTFIQRLQSSLDTQRWDLLNLLQPIGWIIVAWLVVQACVAVSALLLYKVFTKNL